MAGAFSGHLLETYETAQRMLKGPFGQPIASTPKIALHGSMSFAPHMHGTFPTQSAVSQDTTLLDLSEETSRRIATLQAKLNKKLGPEYISQRPGPGGGPKLTYAEGWKIINLANEVFGFNGWSSHVVSLTTDFIDCNEQSQRYSIGVTAIVRVTLRDGVYHEDVGYGLLENSKSKGAALDKCKKEAVTDGIKRSLRNFGNLLGNCLYDKSYTQEVVKMKVSPPKFNKEDLHRRPEFEDSKVGVAPVATTTTSMNAPNKPTTIVNRSASPAVKTEPKSRMEAILSACNTSAPQGLPAASVASPQLRSGPGQTGPVAASTPNVKGLIPVASHANDTASSRAAPPPQDHQPQRRQTEMWTVNTLRAAQPQDQQSVQRTSVPPPPGDRRVSFAQQPVASTSTAPTAVPLPAPADDVDIPDDESEFHFNSDDDAFLAQVDLGEEGIGGPIDFDEGVDGLEANEDSGIEVHGSRQMGQPPALVRSHPPYQQREQQHHVDPQMEKAPQLQYAVSNSSSTSHKHQTASTSSYTAKQNPRDVSSTPLAQSPPIMGGFHFPTASASDPHTSDLQHPGQAARANYTSTAGGSSIGTKRTADVMQGDSSAGAAPRRPMQGMGLAPPPNHNNRLGLQGSTAQGHRREVFAALESGDGGDVKRMRR